MAMDKRKVAPTIDPDVLAECGYHGPKARDMERDRILTADGTVSRAEVCAREAEVDAGL